MTKSMITHLDEEQVRRFDRLAEQQRLSRAELLRRLINDYLDQHRVLPRPVPSWPDLDPQAPPLDAEERRRVLTERYEARAHHR